MLPVGKINISNNAGVSLCFEIDSWVSKKKAEVNPVFYEGLSENQCRVLAAYLAVKGKFLTKYTVVDLR